MPLSAIDHVLRLVPLALLPSCLYAQAPGSAKTAPTSIVSGHVFCADTNAPARLAKVLLEPAAALDHQQPEKEGADFASIPTVRMTSVQTLPDGSFSIGGVAPGAYYVMASSPGYVSPFAALGLSDDASKKLDDDAKKLILKKMPRVVVEANLPASIDVTLERGAAVNGTVLYDDGSPAAGLFVRVLIKGNEGTGGNKDRWVKPATTPVGGGELPTLTDDRGNYRISALPAHEYIVEVDLSIAKTNYVVKGSSSMSTYSDGNSDSLKIYSGSKTRMKDALSFSVKLGEERTGEDIQIPLGKLHSISGNVVAARDGHIVNGGTISLLYADDKTQLGEAHLGHDENSFSFNFVPEGDYILRATNPSDVEYNEMPRQPDAMAPPFYAQRAQHYYDNADQPLHVEADLTGVTIAVPEKSAKQAPTQP